MAAMSPTALAMRARFMAATIEGIAMAAMVVRMEQTISSSTSVKPRCRLVRRPRRFGPGGLKDSKMKIQTPLRFESLWDCTRSLSFTVAHVLKGEEVQAGRA